MNKLIKKLSLIQRIPTWLLLLLFILSFGVSVMALRNNNQTMVELRSAVYEADKNNGDVAEALNNLRNYVYGHMNTNLASGNNTIKPPIHLKYTYERLQAAEEKHVEAANAQVYTQAQEHCQQQNPTAFSGRTRVPCVQEYVTNHGVQVKQIPASLYQFDFVSPTWSPDLAGWSLVLTGVLLLAFITRFTLERLVKARMNQL